MDINFEFLLTILTLLAFVFWLAEKIARRVRQTEERALPEPVDFFGSFFPVLALVLVIRSFLFEPFTIPSGSMLPSLKVHDFILVNKFAYGVRLPALHNKVLDTGAPKRGDVMVFRFPDRPSQNFIKRVVGLPGDHIQLRGKRLYINGEPVKTRLQNQFVLEGKQISIYVEQLGDKPHLIRYESDVDPFTGRVLERRPTFDLVVPENNYFVLGDNRDRSNDSRFWGTVPDGNVAGEAFYIWMHWGAGPTLPDFSRNGAIDHEEAIQ